MSMLKHAEPIQVLGLFGSQKEQPLRKTDTVVFRRLKPFNATAAEVPNITAANFVTAEGVTPTANTISYTDVTVSLQQYAVLQGRFARHPEQAFAVGLPSALGSALH